MDGKLAVIGIGTMGSMILWRSALRVQGVVGFDSRFPGSEETGVGGDTRLFRMAYKEGPMFAALLEDSLRLWNELNRVSGTRILDQCGGLTISEAGGSYMQTLRDSVRASGAPHEILLRKDLQRRYPQHNTGPEDVGLFDPRAGVLKTDTAVLNAVEQAQDHGATVLNNTKIDRIAPRDGMVELWSGEKSWTFERVVISSGAWTKELLPPSYDSALSAGRVILTWFTARNATEFAPDRFPIFIRDTPGMHMFGAPTVDGNTVKVAGIIRPTTIHPTEALDPEVSSSDIHRSNDVVRELLPGLFPSCVRSRAYPDLYSTDTQPLIGRIEEMPGAYVVSGFSGKGFKMASGVGEAVAEDLFGSGKPHAIGFAAPNRFADGTGTPWPGLSPLQFSPGR